MKESIIKLLEVAVVLLNSTDWIDSNTELYYAVGNRLTNAIYALRNTSEGITA